MIRRTALLVACVVLVVAVPADAFDLNLAVGVDFGGDFDFGGISLSSSTGYNLGLEMAFEVPFIELGAGLEYGFSRGANIVDFDASYYQIYAIGRFFFGPVYIAGRFGYANMSVAAAAGVSVAASSSSASSRPSSSSTASTATSNIRAGRSGCSIRSNPSPCFRSLSGSLSLSNAMTTPRFSIPIPIAIAIAKEPASTIESAT